tara:strand:- start:27 stop:290 length:264 start_codon:yes stop_codon:yes gene_type:complete
MSGLEIYLTIILPLHAIDEAYNCNNIPTTADSKEMNLICNWTEEDYEWYTDDNGRMGYRLKEYSQTDNYFEKRARDKYWNNKQENTQ